MAAAEESDCSEIHDFDEFSWDVAKLKYGLLGLMQIREGMLPIAKPAEVFHLKFLLDPNQTAYGVGTGARHDDDGDRDRDHDKHHYRDKGDRKHRNTKEKGKDKDKDKDKKVTQRPGRSVPDMGETAVMSGPQRGQWWRNIGADGLDVIVRADFSIFSKELLKVPPGHYLQQGGPIEVFVSGPATGLQRMPVQPRGWATVDATDVGGPKYLDRVKTPRWKVIFSSGSNRGDIVVREDASLESDEVAVLKFGAVVEQAGPQELLEEGIIRMPISVPGARQSSHPSNSSKTTVGWVTCDASAQGGPKFFEPVTIEETQLLPPPRAPSARYAPTPVPARRPVDADELGAGVADHHRIWKAINLQASGDGVMPVVTVAQPFAPGKDRTPPDDLVIRWLKDGDVVEQAGHSKKVRGYMVMPVRYKAVGSNGEEEEIEGWVTRRSIDKTREDIWFDEIVDEKTRERRRLRKSNGQHNDHDDDD